MSSATRRAPRRANSCKRSMKRAGCGIGQRQSRASKSGDTGTSALERNNDRDATHKALLPDGRSARAPADGEIGSGQVRRVRLRGAGDSAAPRCRMHNCLRCSHHMAEEVTVKYVIAGSHSHRYHARTFVLVASVLPESGFRAVAATAPA